MSTATDDIQHRTSMLTVQQQQALQKGPILPPLSPTAKRLFLVRHGEVVNPGGDRAVFYGCMDVPLSPLGEQEATAAAVYLSQYDLSHVFCSPLRRAVYGAEQVAAWQRASSQTTTTTTTANRSIVPLDGFKELDRGAWCGKTKDEIGAALMAAFDTGDDESVTPHGGESLVALQRRVMAALRTHVLETMPPGRAAALVSHLQVTRCLLAAAGQVPLSQMTTIPVATASVTCIDYEDNNNNDNNDADGPRTTIHFQSFKPEAGLSQSKDGAN